MKAKSNKIVAILLLVTMLALIAISGTYAKYTSTKSNSDTARVAKWSFTVGGKDLAKETFTFDLFKTITNVDESTETGLSVTDGSIIAPGTSGKFDLVLANASEVDAKYGITFEATNDDSIPVQYKIKVGDAEGEWKTNIADLNQAIESATTMDSNATETVTVYWKWDFERSADADDTALATKDTLPSLTVTATVVAEQVD